MVFPTEDPNLTIRVDALDRKAENILTVKMEIVQIPLAVASDMAGAVKKFSKETGNLSIRTSVKQMLVRQQDKKYEAELAKLRVTYAQWAAEQEKRLRKQWSQRSGKEPVLRNS